jgi:uncharacterized protein YabE (DUF348 family)
MLLTVGMLALLAIGLARTTVTVTVEADGQSQRVHSRAASVGDVLRNSGYVLHPNDRVSPGLEETLLPGSTIRIQRARPVVVDADGNPVQLWTHASTVGEALREANVQLGLADEVWLDGSLVGTETSLEPAATTQRGGPSDPPAPSTASPPAAAMITLRRAVALSLYDGEQIHTLHTTDSTVGQVLEAHGVALHAGDYISPGIESAVVPSMSIVIERSMPVTIQVDGHTIQTRTRADNVAGVLGQEQIALVGQDTVEPSLEAAVEPEMAIRVTRIREEFVLEFEPIPFETIWVPDPEVEIDNIRLAQDGQVGLTKRRYRVRYKDGVETERYLEDVWPSQPPITKTMAYGTKIVIRTMDTPDGPIEYWRKMRVYTTSYTAATCGKARDHPRYGYTRLGWWLVKGIVAVDPTVIPLKTNLYVPGYGHARAGDTGGGVKGKFVDLGYDEWNYQSWHWWSDVYLLTPVPPADDIRWVLPDWPRYPDRRR